MTYRTELETMTASHVRSATIRVPALNLEVSEGKWNYPEESPSEDSPSETTPLKGSDWAIRGSQLFENPEKRN